MKIKRILRSSNRDSSWHVRWLTSEDGVLFTPHGICLIDNSKGGVMFIFNRGGMQSRQFLEGDNPTQRYAVTLAKRFVKSVIDEVPA